ncbi:hypothetical protein YC2023_075970 [Brassica napus]
MKSVAVSKSTPLPATTSYHPINRSVISTSRSRCNTRPNTRNQLPESQDRRNLHPTD